MCEAYITTFLLFFSRVTKTYKELISAFPIVLSMSSLLPLLLRPSTRPFQQFLSFPSPSIKSHSLSFFRLLENIQSTKDHTLSPFLNPYVVFYSTFHFAHPFQLSLCLPPPPSWIKTKYKHGLSFFHLIQHHTKYKHPHSFSFFTLITIYEVHISAFSILLPSHMLTL